MANSEKIKDKLNGQMLQAISKEIEQRFNCKVIYISLCTIINTPNVQVKIQYNEDFVYKPNEHWTIDSICFSERSVRFFRRVDFFDCVKNIPTLN